MITCDLIGRMGNQMFQIATAYAHSRRVNHPYGLPSRASGSYTGEVYFHHLPKVPIRRFNIYVERSHAYHPIPLHLTDAKLSGYWQCEKYFMEYRQEVIDLFKLVPIPMKAGCSIHIRLCDYVQFKDKHPPVSIAYLNDAISFIKQETNTGHFLVFSDDIQEAKGLLSRTDHWDTAWFDYCEDIDPKIAIRKMSGCWYNIIANSSFSWWGAWLNPNPDKIVIAPKVWFGPGNSNLTDRDIVPEIWIRL